MNLVCFVVIFVLIIILAALLIHDKREQGRQALIFEEQYREEKERLRDLYSFIVLSNPTQRDDDLISANSLLNNTAQGEFILTPDMINETDCIYYDTSQKTSILNKDISAEVNKSDIIMLQFTAYTESGYAQMEVSFGNKRNVVNLGSSPTEFYIPISGIDKINSLRFEIISDFVKTTIDSVYLVNYSDAYSIHQLRTGSFVMDSCINIDINSDERIIGRSTQLLKNGSYLYAISIDKGTLTAYEEKSDGAVEELSFVTGMGTIRDMDFTSDGKYLVVTARQNGVYLVDISDSTNISIISHYDSLEFATGLDIQGDYAFICSRYFGIEIVDISDPYSPRFITCLSSNGCEYQDCCVDGNNLYVGVYYDKRVDIFDISDISKASKISEIDLDGSGQGVYVEDGILYAATALDSPTSTGELYDYGKGTGNGLEIYDVTTAEDPVHLSTVKTDGRLSINTNDVWDIVVSHGYAFLSNMFGGVYVYDVTNPKAPSRMAQYDIIAKSEDSLYQTYDFDRYLFPYDGNIETRGCAYHVVLDEGYFYFVAANMGIYRIDSEYAHLIDNDESEESPNSLSDIQTTIPQVRGYNIDTYRNSDCVWAVDEHNGKYYVANGEGGIVILDSSLTLVNSIPTQYSVKDLVTTSDYLFTAESEGGIGVYFINSDYSLTEIARYSVDSQSECITQIQLSFDNNFIIAQASISSYKIIDISMPNWPRDASVGTEKEVGLMYYRNLCRGVVANKYIGIAGSNNQYWYESVNGNLQLINTIQNSLYNKSCGFASAGEVCLAIYKNGYVYFDPKDGSFSDRIKIEGVTFEGKCSINNNVLVISTSYNGNVQIVDISNLDAPRLMASFSVNGNPDVASFDGESILLPCRYYGLLKITKQE